MLFAVQAVCAAFLFWECISLYWNLVKDLGQQQDFDWVMTALSVASVRMGA